MSENERKLPLCETDERPPTCPDGSTSLLLLRDAAVIVAFVIVMFFVGWAGLRLSRLILVIVPAQPLGSYAGVVTFPMLGIIRGVGHFACGYFLARELRRINPWHVLYAFAILTVAIVFWTTPWSELPQIAITMNMPMPLIVFQQIVVSIFMLLFVSLGIWYRQRRLKR